MFITLSSLAHELFNMIAIKKATGRPSPVRSAGGRMCRTAVRSMDLSIQQCFKWTLSVLPRQELFEKMPCFCASRHGRPSRAYRTYCNRSASWLWQPIFWRLGTVQNRRARIKYWTLIADIALCQNRSRC